MLKPAPRLDLTCSLFLDVDGTLVGFAHSPGAVVVDDTLKTLLQELSLRLHGALALVSGRRLAQLVELFAPLRLPMAGLHGGERSGARGEPLHALADDSRLNGARARLKLLLADESGVEIEDKGAAIAVHFRRAPAARPRLAPIVAALTASLGDDYHVLEGNMVLEIKPTAFTKAHAIEAFMQEPPFAGRKPVFLGDDVTDLDGFRLVERHGGTSIAVGDRVNAQWRLADPKAVTNWLNRALLPAQDAAG